MKLGLRQKFKLNATCTIRLRGRCRSTGLGSTNLSGNIPQNPIDLRDISQPILRKFCSASNCSIRAAKDAKSISELEIFIKFIVNSCVIDTIELALSSFCATLHINIARNQAQSSSQCSLPQNFGPTGIQAAIAYDYRHSGEFPFDITIDIKVPQRAIGTLLSELRVKQQSPDSYSIIT